jgi:hypothetical protein
LIQVKAPAFEVRFALVEPRRILMTVITDNTGTSPRRRGVAGWLRAMLARFANGYELRDTDCAEFDQIARDLNLSPSELHTLAVGNGSSPALLERRMAEFALAPATVKREHPEVMRDLQRVCGMCPAVKRCASDFANRTPASSRSEYCANTPTLRALGRENTRSNVQEFAPIGPPCC